MTMIEKVVRAMYPQYEWGLNNGSKDIMHKTAKVAIEAMLEPTEEMINAGLASTSTHLDIKGSQLTVNREKMKVRYKAMLMKALKV